LIKKKKKKKKKKLIIIIIIIKIKIKIKIYKRCYVGRQKFHIALEKIKTTYPDVQIETVWHPYMIDPETQINGEKYMDYNVRRWGGGKPI